MRRLQRGASKESICQTTPFSEPDEPSKGIEPKQGPKAARLADFLIGATAEVRGASLITDNKRDFAATFRLSL